MGGYGSGRVYWRTPRPTVESKLSLDVRRLHRDGQLQPRNRGSTSWRWHNGNPAGSISHRAVGNADRAKALILEYQHTRNGQSEQVKQTVWLEWTPCNYGGSRPWALCPRCARRVAILYAGRRFACRHCHDLAYASSRESASDRGIRKAQAIRQRLGGSANLARPFPHKPKGMHWETYDRLENEAHIAYYRAMLDVVTRLNLALDPRGRR